MSSVDVIVPCYRYGHFLRECVESVLTQSLETLRVLILDDASPDNTAEVAAELVKKDARITYLRHTANRGHINTYNEGIEWASADYMLILSADDYLLPGALNRAARLMDDHGEVGFTFGEVIELGDIRLAERPKGVSTSHTSSHWIILPGQKFIELSGGRNIVRTPSAVVRTQLQKRLGGYRYDLPHAADMELWLRFAASASVGMLKAYQAVYRRHSGNMSLAYTWLPDLQQRKAAFDIFFNTYRQNVPDARSLRRRLFRSLGCDAISYASAAFNQGEAALSEELSAFGIGISPGIKTSVPWIKLACKRRLGFKIFSALRPSVPGAARARRV